MRTGLMCFLVLATAATALADDLDEGGKLFAVQNRKYVVSHEFLLGVGTMPMDAYYKGLTGTASYTYHFNDLWAWEIVSGSYSLNIDTELREELQANWGVKPTEFPELSYFGDSNLVIKPLYGKLAYLNESLIYGELFFTLGPALASYKNAGLFLGPNVGAGLRFYLSESFALRFDIRDYFFMSVDDFSDTNHELFLQAAIGFNVH